MKSYGICFLLVNIRQHYYSREVIETSLGYADILKLNEDELPLVASLLGLSGQERDIVRLLIEKYALEYLVYTHGADFSEVYSSTGEYSHVPTPKVKVVDTVSPYFKVSPWKKAMPRL